MLSTGIEGLDNLLVGGISEGHIVSVIGTFGTGKTILGIHFLYEGLKNGENCLFLSFDEDEESIIENSKSIGMDLTEFGDKAQTLKLEAADVKKSIEKLESELPSMLEGTNTTRVVIDTVSVLERLCDDITRYQTLSLLRDVLKSGKITALITSEADKYYLRSSKYGILEYISDGSIFLRLIRSSEFEEPNLALEVVKMRRIGHSRETKPYTITGKGIVVHEEAGIF